MKSTPQVTVSRLSVFSILAVVFFVSMSVCTSVWADNSVNKPHPCDSLKDIKERETEVSFTIKGQAEDAKWGWGKVSDVIYHFKIKSTSKFPKIEKLNDGGRKVIEERYYEKVQDHLLTTPVNSKLRLDTIPLDEIHQACNIVSLIIDSAALQKSSQYINKLKEFDNKSFKTLFDDAVKKYLENHPELKNATRQLEKLSSSLKIRKFLSFIKFKQSSNSVDVLKFIDKAFYGDDNPIKEFHGARSLIKDKKNTFLVTWFVDKDCNVTNVEYRYKNSGLLVTDEETRMILKRGNLLADYCVTRSDDELKPGTTLKVSAEDIQSIFDPFVDGEYRGSIKATAKQQKDTWVFKMEKARLNIETQGKNTEMEGYLNIAKGSITLSEPEGANAVKCSDLKGSDIEAVIYGSANMSHRTKHHWLFTAKFSGNCEFEGTMISKVIKK